jgi:hypothetical protein
MFENAFLERWENAKVNGLGTNEKIKFNPDPELLEKFGFRHMDGFDDIPPHWHWHKTMVTDITLDVDWYDRPYKGAQLQIVMIDESFLQPYDYQALIRNMPLEFVRYPFIVFERVEMELKVLADAGIISGHEYGDYV